MEYVSSSLMLADIYTKEFTDEQKWNSLKRQIGILSPVEKASGTVIDHMSLLSSIPHISKYQQDPKRLPTELLHLDHGLGPSCSEIIQRSSIVFGRLGPKP